MSDAKVIVDWERIEALYRAGLLSVREIAVECGVSHTAINKRSKREGWDRDLSAKIQARAEALVSKAEVSKTVSAETMATERQTIAANAQVIAEIRLSHRADIKKARGVVGKLLGEIEGLTDRPDLVEELHCALAPADETDSAAAKQRADKLREALDRVTSVTSRVGAVKALSEALKNLIALERQAHGLDVMPDTPPDPGLVNLTDAARRIAYLLGAATKDTP